MVAEDLLDAYRRLGDPARAWLRRQGVSTETMLVYPGPVGVAEIDTHTLELFSFADFGQRAFVHPVYACGIDSEIIDAVAWMPSSPARWWTLRNTGWPIGDDQLHYAEFWREPVTLHSNPLAWLAADGDGAVVTDWIMSSPALRSVPTIITYDHEFGREVERRLTMPARTCPPIRVRIGKVAA